MAWDNYHGQHRIKVENGGDRCLSINLQKKNSPYKNFIARVCQDPDGRWRHSSGPAKKPIYGNFKTARAAIKDAVAAHGSWIGVQRTINGARRKRRRR